MNFVKTTVLALIFISILEFSKCHNVVHKVASSKTLQKVLKNVQPGDIIELADGEYSGNFQSNQSGNSNNKIILIGSKRAVITRNNLDGPQCFLLQGKHWNLQGFTVQNCRVGIMLENSKYVKLENLYVHDVGGCAIRLRYNSSDNIVQNCVIANTGLVTPEHGEGIYIGRSDSKKDTADFSDGNTILNNTFRNITAENIDIKEGTCCGLVKGNIFNGYGMKNKLINSWLNLKGTKYTIRDNVGDYSFQYAIVVIFFI